VSDRAREELEARGKKVASLDPHIVGIFIKVKWRRGKAAQNNNDPSARKVKKGNLTGEGGGRR